MLGRSTWPVPSVPNAQSPRPPEVSFRWTWTTRSMIACEIGDRIDVVVVEDGIPGVVVHANRVMVDGVEQTARNRAAARQSFMDLECQPHAVRLRVVAQKAAQVCESLPFVGSVGLAAGGIDNDERGAQLVRELDAAEQRLQIVALQDAGVRADRDRSELHFGQPLAQAERRRRPRVSRARTSSGATRSTGGAEVPGPRRSECRRSAGIRRRATDPVRESTWWQRRRGPPGRARLA